MTTAQGYSPTVGKRRLAAILVDLRKQCGMTTADAAKRLGISRWTLYRAEHGEWVKPQVGLVLDLCELYGVPADQRDSLVQLTRDANKRGWWHSYRDLFGENDFIGFEAGASAISVYEPTLVTGLLQTPAYTEHITRAAGITDEQEVKRRAEARQRRQEILDRSDSPQLTVVFTEAAIAARVGSPAEHREQVKHICTMAQRPNVTVQLIRFADGPHPAMATGPFTLLDFASDQDRSILYVETKVDSRYLEEEGEVEPYRTLFERLREVALDAEATRTYLEQCRQMLE